MIDKRQAKANGFNVAEGSNQAAEEKKRKLEALKKLAPELVNGDGQVNVRALEDFVDLSRTTANNKGYELTFAGKGMAKAKADEGTDRELRAEKGQSKDFETTGNVVIRGDNLDVLKILKQTISRKSRRSTSTRPTTPRVKILSTRIISKKTKPN